jgi:drug/metabolite transporter (DMT)-like permease
MIVSYVLAVLAAAFNAASNLLQRKANREEPSERSMSLRLIVDLLHRPVWLAGVGAVVASFLLMAAALRLGRLAAVQPVLALELPLTLVGASWAFGARLRGREWTAAIVMTAGLAALIACLAPAAGTRGRASGLEWALASAACIGLILACIGMSSRGGPARRPALLGVAAGVNFGLSSAYMKGMTTGLDHGLLGVLRTWQSYAMVASGLTAMFLMQNALQAGRLIAAQPGLTLADPLIAIAWGVVVFQETTRGGIYLLLAGIAMVAVAVGVFILVRSPLLQGDAATEEAPG